VVSQLARTELETNVVSAGYFEDMNLPLVAGHGFAGYQSEGECRIGIVNREAADLYFNSNAVGAAVIDDRGRRTKIIGVVRTSSIGTFQRRVEPAIYFPMLQDTPARMVMIVHANESGATMLANLRRTIGAVAGQGPAPLVLKTLDEYLNQTSLAPLHIATMIVGASAGMALTLSVLGLFGAMSDAARQRRRELAMRIALGAQRWRVIGQVLKEGGRLALIGTVIGTVASLLSSKLLNGITMRVNLPALWVWLAAPILLAAAVAIASILPARRALLVSPLLIMRDGN
jgi:putative ABC transport system permease protein